MHKPSSSTPTSLITRNVRIGPKRTSVRLEPELWRALEDIAQRENCDINEICKRVSDNRTEKGGFTSALRVHIVNYWSHAAMKSLAA
ncbi:MAG: ribbon-helix-helix domain-containing protein [Rhodobacteraceae bacterium]|nr:ribbon-helix-helix domain-containing protein [Paracoccaceae bacterium]